MYPKKHLNVGKPWNSVVPPFHILKGISFVGAYHSSVHLIDTGDGLVMLDTGYLKSFYLVVNGIYSLGYDPKDIKYVFLTHWHDDHVESVNAVRSIAPNAKAVIGIRDDQEVIKHGFFTPDIVVKDGDTITLGKVTFRFMETPGHSIGTVSLFFDYEEDGVVYHVGTFGGAGPDALFEDDEDWYPAARDDYFRSIEKMRKEKVNVFLGNHCWNNDTDGKAQKLAEDPAVNPFIDENEFPKFLDHCEARVRRRMAERGLEK